MRFDWDRRKSEAESCRAWFDFSFATLVFDNPTLERPDDRQDYGELRIVATGIANGVPITVVYTDCADGEGGIVRPIISARVSNRHERKVDDEAFSTGC